MEEAVSAFTSLFAEVPDGPAQRSVPFVLAPETDRELLVLLLEEVLYLVEVLGAIPYRCEVQPTEDGGIAGFFEVVDVSEVRLKGSVPKAVTRHELVFERRDEHWYCRVIVDV